MKTGKYDNVFNYFGESVEHYGKKDAETYFAEERFQNDDFPINQSTGSKKLRI